MNASCPGKCSPDLSVWLSLATPLAADVTALAQESLPEASGLRGEIRRGADGELTMLENAMSGETKAAESSVLSEGRRNRFQVLRFDSLQVSPMSRVLPASRGLWGASAPRY